MPPIQTVTDDVVVVFDHPVPDEIATVLAATPPTPPTVLGASPSLPFAAFTGATGWIVGDAQHLYIYTIGEGPEGFGSYLYRMRHDGRNTVRLALPFDSNKLDRGTLLPEALGLYLSVILDGRRIVRMRINSYVGVGTGTQAIEVVMQDAQPTTIDGAARDMAAAARARANSAYDRANDALTLARRGEALAQQGSGAVQTMIEAFEQRTHAIAFSKARDLLYGMLVDRTGDEAHWMSAFMGDMVWAKLHEYGIMDNGRVVR